VNTTVAIVAGLAVGAFVGFSWAGTLQSYPPYSLILSAMGSNTAQQQGASLGSQIGTAAGSYIGNAVNALESVFS
jgi:hypothetical protein